MPPLETETRATYDGEWRETHSDAHSAAKELRRRRDEDPASPYDPPVDRLEYIDGRAPDATVDIKEAAQDIDRYRQEKADQQQQPPAEQQQAAADPNDILGRVLAQLPPEQRQSIEEQSKAYHQQYAADQQKFVEEWNAAQLARNNYSLALNALAANLSGHNLQEFADLKTHADLQRVAQSDPARFQRFQAMNQHLGAVQTELARVTAEQQQVQQQQFQQQYANWSRQQDELATQLIPETRSGDTEALKALQTASREVLNEAGFTDDEMRHAWQHGGYLYLRDARAQRIIADAARFRMAQAKAKQAVAQKLPPVMRPGVAGQARGYSYDEIEAMRRQLTDSGSLKDAAKLRAAQVQARKRGW